MKAWDGEKYVEPGATRWVCEWYLWREGTDLELAPDPVEDSVCCSRNFPTKPLAEAFGRRVTWEVWGPTVHREAFSHDYTGPEGRFGSWDQLGEREDVEDLAERKLTNAELSTNSPEAIARLAPKRTDR